MKTDEAFVLGEKVQLVIRTHGHQSKYSSKGWYTIESINSRMVVLSKDTGYKTTVNIIDLRQKLCRLLLESGEEIKFPPMVNHKKREEIKLNKEMEEYRSQNKKAIDEWGNARTVTKAQVKELWDKGMLPEEISKELEATHCTVVSLLSRMGLINKAKGEKDMSENVKLSKAGVMALKEEGKTAEEIVEYFAPNWNGKLQPLKAKVTLYMSDRKLGGPKKKSEVPVEDCVDTASFVETEQPDLKAFAEEIKQDFDKKAKESAEKVKLNVSQEVDEMMGMVPDYINHPAHYTAGTIEVIDYLQDKMLPEMFEGFCIGNALKYLSRYRFKGGTEDLKKAEWYLSRIIKTKETA